MGAFVYALVRLGLLGHDLCFGIKELAVRLRPPVVEVPVAIELAPFVVVTVAEHGRRECAKEYSE